MTEILFFLGFIVLIVGANMLVEGSSSIGKKLGIPSIVIGLTIVAFGTSLPELVISGFAAFRGDKCAGKQFIKYTHHPWYYSHYNAYSG